MQLSGDGSSGEPETWILGQEYMKVRDKRTADEQYMAGHIIQAFESSTEQHSSAGATGVKMPGK